MARNFVNLNINPCKMCMPMGGVMAFKGIEDAVTILHGSQGCSTYIRRHMATHYNEPIDIASTSLSEKGTVYGGAENLKQGIRNVVSVYQPQLVGVLTTCLAETIGEDVNRIIAELYEEEPSLRKITIIPVSTPGYGGTQTEGYYKALRAVVERVTEQADYGSISRENPLDSEKGHSRLGSETGQNREITPNQKIDYSNETNLSRGSDINRGTNLSRGMTLHRGFSINRESILNNKTQRRRKRAKPRLNIIPANLNPGDIREIKQILEDFGIEYILLPDVSVTLDAPFLPEYRRIPEGGTKLSDIRAMADATATIEMGMTVEDSLSPGVYLRDKFGIPLYRCSIPSGLANTDRFLDLLSDLSGRGIPAKYTDARGRLLDAMIDAHKYNAQARAAIYGDAEQVLSLTSLCLENGIKPVLMAVGAENPKFRKAISKLLSSSTLFSGEKPVILDDTDFETIGSYAVELEANMLMGNSDGRRIAEKYGLDLIRIGFPIHDRVGGQRKHFTGYSGTTALVDELANSILAAKEKGYRQEMYERYYLESESTERGSDDTEHRSNDTEHRSNDTKQGTSNMEHGASDTVQGSSDIEKHGHRSVPETSDIKKSMTSLTEGRDIRITEVQMVRGAENRKSCGGKEKSTCFTNGQKTCGTDMHRTSSSKVQISHAAELQGKTCKKEDEIMEDKAGGHPCFNAKAHNIARMHLPVAPACNITCNYCSRKYDCPNESRPGVTSEVLTPEEALARFKLAQEKIPNLKVIGIAGPGDALANFAETAKCLELIRKEDPSITFCLSTNGLMLPFYCADLIKLGVTHVTITINAVDPAIGAMIYRNVNYLGKSYFGKEGAALLLHNQLSGLRYLAAQGVICKVNIVMVKGINDTHVPEVVQKVKECGAYITNIMKMIPAPGSMFENKPSVSQAELVGMRKSCEVYMKQMHHCRQCRADAVGLLSEDRSSEFGCNKGCAPKKKKIKAIELAIK